MKYYQLMRYADNSVGADFGYATEDEVEEMKEDFKPNHTEEISKEDYEDGLARVHRMNTRMLTGYPK